MKKKKSLKFLQTFNNIKRIIKHNFKKFENLHKMEKFLQKYKLQKVTQDGKYKYSYMY